MSYCSATHFSPDIISIDRALRQQLQTEDLPRALKAQKAWNLADEFAIRFSGNKTQVAHARSWIQDDAYWEREVLHFQTLTKLLAQLDEDEGDGSRYFRGFASMTALKHLYEKHAEERGGLIHLWLRT